MAFIAAATIAYLYLLGANIIEVLRGNSQWHLPYMAHPPNAWWWVPLPTSCRST